MGNPVHRLPAPVHDGVPRVPFHRHAGRHGRKRHLPGSVFSVSRREDASLPASPSKPRTLGLLRIGDTRMADAVAVPQAARASGGRRPASGIPICPAWRTAQPAAPHAGVQQWDGMAAVLGHPPIAMAWASWGRGPPVCRFSARDPRAARPLLFTRRQQIIPGGTRRRSPPPGPLRPSGAIPHHAPMAHPRGRPQLPPGSGAISPLRILFLLDIVQANTDGACQHFAEGQVTFCGH